MSGLIVVVAWVCAAILCVDHTQQWGMWAVILAALITGMYVAIKAEENK